MPSFSHQLALDYLLFPSFQSSPLHIASTSLAIHIGPSFSSKRPPWIVTLGPFSVETYWLFWWSRAALQKYSPIFIQMRAPAERAIVRINAQISTISPQLHVCQTLCRGGITRCLLFFPACQACGTHGENRSLHSGWWQEPQCPAFGLHAAGIRRDEPDDWYPGSKLWKQTAMACTKCHNLLTASR